MCGIAGFAGNFSAEFLGAMSERIMHRGPDGAGLKIFNTATQRVGLAHRRLAIIDLSSDGQQPMTSKCDACGTLHDEKVWLIYNGELYNYKELRAELIAKGHQFSSQTDSEVLLHLYAQEGEGMLKYLNGMFAFAIYDARRNEHYDELFIARDGLGIKPLYYAETKDGLAFASELKALLAYPDLKREIDLTALHGYLAYLWNPGDKTALQSVKKMQPGEAFIVRAGKIVKRWFFYDLPYNGEYSTASQEESQQELECYLRQAIERQMMADVPVGAFLSGGLDSSAIVAMVKKYFPDHQLNCYTVGMPGGMQSEGVNDDLPYAKQMATYSNVNLKVVESDESILSLLQKMIYHLDEPQADPAPLHVLRIAEAARADGVKVLLSGAGGDDIFSGYRRHQALYYEKWWQWLPQSWREKMAETANGFALGHYPTKFGHQPFIRRSAKLLAQAHLTQDARIANHFVWSPAALRFDLYTPEVKAALANTDCLTPLLHTLGRIPSEKNPLNRMLYLEGKHFLPDHNLNYTDKLSMAAGVEVRVPLLDQDLVNFATKLPPHFKQKRSTGKYLFRKAMAAHLPAAILSRPKTGFGAPLRKWLHHDLAPLVNDILQGVAVKNRGIFDAQAVQSLLRADREKKVDASYTLFSVLCIELWCQQFIDQ